MKKLATLFFSLLLACLSFAGAASPAHANEIGFTNTGETGPGPRVNFGLNDDSTKYMIVGAYDNLNNIDTKDRPLKIHSSSDTDTIVVQITQLPNASAAPSGTELASLKIDPNTGQLYIGKQPTFKKRAKK